MKILRLIWLILAAAIQQSVRADSFVNFAYAQTAAQMIENKFSRPTAYLHSIRLRNTPDPTLLYRWNQKNTPLIHTNNSNEQPLFTIDQSPWKSSGQVQVPMQTSHRSFGKIDPNQAYFNALTFTAPLQGRIFPMSELQITTDQQKLLAPIQENLITSKVLFSKDVNTGTVAIASQQLNGSCLLDWTILIYEGFLLNNLESISGLTHLFYYCIDLDIDLASNEITVERIIMVGWTGSNDKFSGECTQRYVPPQCAHPKDAITAIFCIGVPGAYLCDNFSVNLKLSYISGDDLIKKNVSDKFNYSLDQARESACSQESS
jgi:hypothetical protein